MHEFLHNIATLSGHADKVTAVDFAPGRSDRVLSSGRDGAIAVWTLFGEETAEADLLRHGAPIVDAKFWPDARGVLFASDDSTARLFDLNTVEESARFTLNEAMKPGTKQPSTLGRSLSETVNAAGQIVAAFVPLGVLITAASRAGEQDAGVTSVAADALLGRVATLDAKHKLTLFDLVTAEPMRSWTIPADDGAAMRFLANGMLAVVCSSKIILFNENDPKPVASQKVGRSGVAVACELSRNRIAVFDNSKQLSVFDTERNALEPIVKIPHPPVAISPAGPSAVVIADSKRRVARIRLDRPGDETWHDTEGGKVRAIDGSDDSTRIAFATDDLRVRVVEIRYKQEPAVTG